MKKILLALIMLCNLAFGAYAVPFMVNGWSPTANFVADQGADYFQYEFYNWTIPTEHCGISIDMRFVADWDTFEAKVLTVNVGSITTYNIKWLQRDGSVINTTEYLMNDKYNDIKSSTLRMFIEAPRKGLVPSQVTMNIIFRKKDNQGISGNVTAIINSLTPVTVTFNSPVQMVGSTAHDTAYTTSPLLVGLYATDLTNLPASVNNGDVARAVGDPHGLTAMTLATLIAGENQTYNRLDVGQKIGGDSANAFTTDVSTALEGSSLALSTAGVFYGFDGRIDSTATGSVYYFQVINNSNVPPDGAVTMLRAPRKIQHTPGYDDYFSIDYGLNGIYASSGIVWCVSTTEFTKTGAPAIASGTLIYKAQ